MAAPYAWLHAYDEYRQQKTRDEAFAELLKQPQGPDFDAAEAANKRLNIPEWEKGMSDITAYAGANFQKAKDAGIINAAGDVDWNKAPKMGPGDPGKNYLWAQQSGPFGTSVDPWSKKPSTGLGTYEDPNYGTLFLEQIRSPDSSVMKYGRAATFAMAMMPMAGVLGPALASGMGVSSSTGSILANLLLGSGRTLAQGGQLNLGSMAGSALGAYSGIPMGSTLGGIAGGYAGNALQGGGGGGGGGGYNQPTPQQMQQIQNMTPQQKQLLVQLLTQKYGR